MQHCSWQLNPPGALSLLAPTLHTTTPPRPTRTRRTLPAGVAKLKVAARSLQSHVKADFGLDQSTAARLVLGLGDRNMPALSLFGPPAVDMFEPQPAPSGAVSAMPWAPRRAHSGTLDVVVRTSFCRCLLLPSSWVAEHGLCRALCAACCLGWGAEWAGWLSG